MRTPDEVAAMLRLKALGWGTRRIAGSWGARATRCGDTSRRVAGRRPDAAARERARRTRGVARRALPAPRGNADVVRQELAAERGISVSACARWSGRWRICGGSWRARGAGDGALRDAAGPAAADRLRRAAGSRSAGRAGGCFLFVATLGYSRRLYVRAFRHERQERWFDGIESAFRHVRRRAGGGAARQRPGAGRAPRRGDPRGGVQRTAARLRPLLGLPAAGLRAVPGAHQGQGRARRRLRQAQRASAGRRFASWAALEAHLAGGRARSPTSASTARPARRRSAALRARRGDGPAAARRPAAVPAGARAASARCRHGLLRRGRHQRLHRALAADRRARPGDRRGRRCASSHAGARSQRTRKPAGRHQRVVDRAHFEGVRWLPAAGCASRPGTCDRCRKPSRTAAPARRVRAAVGGALVTMLDRDDPLVGAC